MLNRKDRQIARIRAKLWDHMGWSYKSPLSLSKNNSLNRGCSSYKRKTHIRRLQNKQERLKNRQSLILKNMKRIRIEINDNLAIVIIVIVVFCLLGFLAYIK